MGRRCQITLTWLILVAVAMTTALLIGYAVKENILAPAVREQERIVNATTQ
jgi:hypothetical protein